MAYKLLIDGVVLLMICVTGFIANSLTLYILNSGHEMRSQTINLYLSFLAIYDNGVLFTGILMFSLPAISHLRFIHNQPPPAKEPANHVIPNLPTEDQLAILKQLLNSGAILPSTSPLNEHLYQQLLKGGSKNNHQLFNFNISSNFDSQEIDFNTHTNIAKPVINTKTDDGENDDERQEIADEEEEEEVKKREEFENPSHYYISFVYPIALIVQTGSIWTTCLVTVERYWAVTYPLRAMVLSTRKRALFALTAVSMASIVYNLPRFFEVQITTNEVTGVKIIEQTSLRLNETYRLVYYILLNLLLTHVIPLTTLTVLNFKINKQIKAANVNRAQLSATQRSELNVSSMLMVLVLIFIICNVPAFVVNVLEVIGFNSSFIDFCATISNVLVCINSSVNFLIYCIHGRSFRTRFLQIMFCRRRVGSEDVTIHQSHVYTTNNVYRAPVIPACVNEEEISLDILGNVTVNHGVNNESSDVIEKECESVKEGNGGQTSFQAFV